MNPVNVIVTLERFPIHWPGAYGNRTHPASALDAFTLESTVLNRLYTLGGDATETLRQMISEDFLNAFPGGQTFLTDRLEGDEWVPMERERLPAEAFFTADLEMAPDELLWVHFQHWTLEQLDAWLLDWMPLAILSTSGVPAISDDGMPPLLHQTEIQLPGWIRFSDPAWKAVRYNGLVTPEDLAALWLEGLPTVRREAVVTRNAPRWSVVTDDWFLTCDERRAELYNKPDDWWEQNDVAVRCAGVMDDLIARFAPSFR